MYAGEKQDTCPALTPNDNSVDLIQVFSNGAERKAIGLYDKIYE